MKVLINAISIKEGGGLVVLTQLVTAFCEAASSAIQWYIFAPPSLLGRLPTTSNLYPLPCAWALRTPAHLLYAYNIVLPKRIKQLKIDLLFSTTNFLPHRNLACPTLLLIHQAGYFKEPSAAFNLQWRETKIAQVLWRLKIKWAHQSIKAATAITVQTQTLSSVVQNEVCIDQRKIAVIPHGPGLLNSTLKSSAALSFINSHKNPQRQLLTQPRIWRVGYITKFGIQKDFFTAIKAIALLKKQGISLRLILTLDEHDPSFAPIFQCILNHHLEEQIENHGNVSAPKDLQKLYESLDLFIFPSLCESFGFTLIEAMSHGLPVIVADTANHREVCGEAGLPFPARNAECLADKIKRILQDRAAYTLAATNSFKRATHFCWSKTAHALLSLLYTLKPTPESEP